jgi:hypothetical protein
MKTLKSITLASLLAAGLAGVASANTIQYVHIAGAPAYRQDSIAVISAVVTAAGGGETTSTSTDDTNASAEQWYIPNYSTGVDLVVSASFTGSTAGVESVAAGAQNSGAVEQKFIPDASSTQAAISSPTNSSSVTITEAHVPDFTLSDTFQATTPFNGTVTLTQGSTGAVHNTYTFATLTPIQLAIEPYVWVGTPGLAARGVTNITTAQAQLLYKNGKLPLSFFTGKNSDETSFVYPLSRDPGSGSRLIAVAETGVGVTTSIKTYKPTVTGATADSLGNYVKGTISGSVTLYPAGLISSTQIYDGNAGDTGYPKFGTADQTGLLAAITSTPTVNASSPSTAQYFIGYFNPTDSAEAIAAGSEQLTYNGVTYSATNLAEGLYTFWSYEILFEGSTISGNQASFANAISAAWPNATLVSGVQTANVNVTRSVDGGPITANY